MGATSPGRWHVWQFFCRIGRTSLLNVGAEVDCCVAATRSDGASNIANTSKPARANCLGSIVNLQEIVIVESCRKAQVIAGASLALRLLIHFWQITSHCLPTTLI